MKKIFILLSCLWMAIATMANNVTISNISLIGSAGNFRIQFDLSWENGWRVSTGQNNYDGVWVFFKFRLAGGNWQHLTMTGTNNTVPANYTAYQNTGVTKTGAIIHRTNDFSGTTTLTNIVLGVSDIAGFNIDIRGYAIEMVYIPQCSNWILGDGNGANESLNAFHVDDNTSAPVDGSSGDFSVDVNSFDDATMELGFFIGPAGINAGGANTLFPTGQALWCMKYELSQSAYRDFLNSLILTEQITRTANAPTSAIGTGALIASGTNRNFIEIATPSTGGAPAVYGCDANGNNIFDEAADGEWVACNFLSWQDLAAYLDWAGLAPMSEIVFERICRGASSIGANPSVLNEYAWGTTSIFASTYTLTNATTASEIASNSSTTLGNANYTTTKPTPNGPLRNGIFSTGTSSRVTSGASFYGVMEMSGNLSEPCVTVGNVAGRGFTSINGDGVLSGNGNANASAWPCGASPSSSPSCSEVTNSAGTILRGGGFSGNNTDLRVSERPGVAASSARTNSQGGRGVLYIH